MQATIYEQLRAAGCDIENHESDLYVRDTHEARTIIRANCKPIHPFRSHDGSAWLEVAFAYDPFWTGKK